MPRGPVERGVRLITEGRENRHHHHGEQSAGKAHVVKVHAILHLIGVRRKRRHQKSHNHAGQNAQRQAGMNAAQRHIAHQRRKGCRKQRHGGVFGKRLPLIPSVQPRSQNDGPDIKKILPEQGKARHQSHLHDGKTVEGVLGQPEDADRGDGHQAGVDESGGRPRNVNIVCDQQILHGHDFPESRQDLLRASHADPDQHQCNGKSNGGRKNRAVTSCRIHKVPPVS